MFVAGIQIEIAACNDDVFRVRCFENQQPAGLQHAQRFADDRSNMLERHMLDNMKSRNKDVTIWSERGEMLDSITLKYRQTALPARFEHIGIEVHTNRTEPRFYHDLQPFAATAAQVECLPARVERRERRDERLILRQSAFDQFPCASMLIFERAIKAIHYGKLLTVVCSHATPTKLAIPRADPPAAQPLVRIDVIDGRAPGTVNDLDERPWQHAYIQMDVASKAVTDTKRSRTHHARQDHRRSRKAGAVRSRKSRPTPSTME